VNYGVTWRAVSGSIGNVPGGGIRLGWGHAQSTSVMLVTTTSLDPALAATNYIVDMGAVTPTLTAIEPYVLPDDAFAMANGEAGPSLAVAAAATGNLSTYVFADAITRATLVGTLPAFLPHPNKVAFGGSSSGSSPSALLVSSSDANSPTRAVLKSSGAATFDAADASAVTNADACIDGGPGGAPSADIAPGSDLDSGALMMLANCDVRPAGASDPLAITRVNGSNGTMVYDAGFAEGDDEVVLATDGGRGVIKADTYNSSGPVFDLTRDALPGFGLGSAGIAVNGLTVPVVKGVALGPDGAGADVSTIVSMSGGGVSLASTDSGATFTTAVKVGGYATAWWHGTGADWLLFGHGGAGNILTARSDWTPASTALDRPNVSITDPGIENGNVRALMGVPDADSVFLGAESTGGGPAGLVTRFDLSGSGDSITATEPLGVAGTTRSDPVLALAYCPASSPDPAMADTLFVGEGADGSGQITKVANASTTTAFTGTTLALPGHASVNALAVDCSSQTLWAGTGTGNVGGLYKSTDAGGTFTPVAPFVQPSFNVTALGINALDPAEVLVAANADGMIAQTRDSGASWSDVNDPLSNGRSFMGEGVSALAIPPAPPSVSSLSGKVGASFSATGPKPAVVGTGGGLLATSLGAPAPRGVYGEKRFGDAWSAAAKVVPSTATSATPVLAVDSAGKSDLVYQTVDGLFFTSRTAGAVAWPAATKIPGTVGTDTQPSITTKGTAVYVAYRRTVGSARGIYVCAKLTTTWSSLGRATSLTSAAVPSIGVDSTNAVHLAWQEVSGVKFAKRTGTVWSAPIVITSATAGSLSPSLVVNQTGTASTRVAFSKPGTGIVIATRASTGTWSSATLTGTTAGDVTPSLALDSASKLHLATRRPNTATPGIYYFRNATGPWVKTRVSNFGTDVSPSIAVTRTGAASVYLAWARPIGTVGVYTNVRAAGLPVVTKRSTTSASDKTPDIAVDLAGARAYLVFAR
jgi:hypothetical protein